MLRALVTGGAYTANTDIPLTLDVVTNTKARLNDNTIEFTTVGLQDVKANVPIAITGTGSVSMQMYANGVAIPGAIDTQNVETSGDTVTFHINDVVRVIRDYLTTNTANISFRITLGGTLPTTGNGAIVVEYRN